MRAARVTVMNLQSMAAKRLSQAQAQKLEARLEDLQVWEQRKVKESKAGPKAYTYYMASWREGGKLRNVYLGSSHKDEQRGGPGEGQGSKEGGLRALSHCSSCER